MNNTSREKGSAIVEFTMAGIPMIFLLFTTLQVSIAAWNYFTIDHAVNVAARYAAVHGASCSSNGNTCSVTLGNIATKLANSATGVPANKIKATFTTNSGTQTTCNQLSSCLSDSNVWPPSASNDNQVGANITIKAQFSMAIPLAMFWFRDGMINDEGTFTFPATSTQQIIY
jgi:Flp pilus assembly protein TadG